MALIGPQLTGGHFLFLCIGFIVKPWGGRGEEWVRQGSRETAAGDDTVKNIPVTDPPLHPSAPLPHPTHTHKCSITSCFGDSGLNVIFPALYPAKTPRRAGEVSGADNKCYSQISLQESQSSKQAVTVNPSVSPVRPGSRYRTTEELLHLMMRNQE